MYLAAAQECGQERGGEKERRVQQSRERASARAPLGHRDRARQLRALCAV